MSSAAQTNATGARRRVLSGMQPTGRMHIGNYLGALRNWVRLQDDYDCIYMVADYHALTTLTDPGTLRPATQNMVLDWLAAGLDPERSVIFVQSHIPEVAELHLLLSMATPLSWVERVPTFKEKVEQNPENVNYGLLGYPVLQTADILLPRGELVPVGEDQIPHLELSREIVRRFNHLYSPVFPEPQALVTETPRVYGTDGVNKMSKSLRNTIEMTAEPEELVKRVMTMVTDVQRPRRNDAGHPEQCNVCRLHRTFSPHDWESIWEGERTARSGCVDTKRLLAERMAEYFAPMRERRHALESDPQQVWQILDAGAVKARAIARETIAMAREAMGLRRASR